MNFKRPKEEVIMNAREAASSKLAGQLTTMVYQIRSSSFSNIDSNLQTFLSNLEWQISDAIGSAVRSIVEDTYTDNEFEEDMGLTNEHKQ